MSIVYVYTQPDCRPCKRVIEKLANGGVNHRVIDISRDSLMHDYVVQHLGARSTPVVEAEGVPPIRGYDLEKLQEIIDHYGAHGEPDYTDIHDYVYKGDE